jgi:hypothetical protein
MAQTLQPLAHKSTDSDALFAHSLNEIVILCCKNCGRDTDPVTAVHAVAHQLQLIFNDKATLPYCSSSSLVDRLSWPWVGLGCPELKHHFSDALFQVLASALQ